jgi:hypothetical protein
MRIPVMYVASLLALALAAGPARAQQGGLGLDLSGDSTAQPPAEEQPPQDSSGMGMDLSGGLDLSQSLAGAELLPRFVLVGLETPDRAGAAVAKRWLGWLQAQALRGGQVARAADAAEARQQLEGEYENTVRCGEASCFSAPADTLDADLLTTARLALEGGRWTLRLWTYDRDRGVVETDEVSGRKPTDSNFIRQAGEVLSKRVAELARPRALLKVSSNMPQAVVRVGARMLGVGNVEAKLPPGEVELFVEAEDYEPFTRKLTLVAGETQEVQARLEMAGPAPEGPPVDAVASVKKKKKTGASAGGSSVFSRPAFYTTVVGLAAVGAGVALGMSASGKARDADGDGVLDASRSEYLAARQQSTLSTALLAGGGAVAGGGLLWLLVVPSRTEPSSASLTPTASGAGKAGTALHFVMGGSF